MSTVPIDISYRNAGIPASFRRESFAHSQGMGGISWGGVSVGSWLREEVMLNNMNVPAAAPPKTMPMAMSPDATPAYLPNLEADFCRDYSCCGRLLPTLHDLLRHYEDSHVSPSPPVEPPVMRRMPNMEMVSTNEVFLSNQRPQGANNGTAPGISMSNHNHIHGGAHNAAHGGAHGGQPISMVGDLGDYNGLSGLGGSGVSIAQPSDGLHMPLGGGSASGLGVKDDDEEMCIDDPARQLYVIERSDNKPYKCPVVGCEKAYKNQNGLKYHRLHGHQNQTLHLNDDGTYSIIDPLSNTPYPDGQGMEKDKPYRCEICGKRYKNLNGLKYHRAHSTH